MAGLVCVAFDQPDTADKVLSALTAMTNWRRASSDAARAAAACNAQTGRLSIRSEYRG